jgi:hypothetical protein
VTDSLRESINGGIFLPTTSVFQPIFSSGEERKSWIGFGGVS